MVAQRHTGKTRGLRAFCERWWLERHEAIQTFVEILPEIMAALEDLQEEDSTETATEAHLLRCVLAPSFMVTVVICAKVLSLTLQLSRQLPNPTAGSVQAIAHIDEVEATVAQMGESGYPKVFQIAERLCQQMSLRLDMPLLIARQSRPNDVAAFTREEYVRLLVLLSFLDHFRTQLSKRTTQLLSALLLQNIAEAEKDLNMERINTLCAALFH